jgi:hypothetical protein
LITAEELDALTQSETSIDGSPPLPIDALGAYSQMAHEFPQPNPRGQLDPLIDVMASMELETPVSGEAALAALPPVLDTAATMPVRRRSGRFGRCYN